MTEMSMPPNPSLWRRATAAYAKLLEILLAACVGIVFSGWMLVPPRRGDGYVERSCQARQRQHRDVVVTTLDAADVAAINLRQQRQSLLGD